MIDYVKQSDEPAFPKVLWNRPTVRQAAGRLLVVGGHRDAFSLPQGIYQAARAAGIGECTVALPDSLLRTLAGTVGSRFLPSSGSGSLAQVALGELLSLAEENDAALVGGNLSANSETTILVERLLAETTKPVIMFDDGLTAVKHHPTILKSEQARLIIASMPQFFAIAGYFNVAISIRPDGGLMNKLEIIRDIHEATGLDVLLYGPELIAASDGKFSVTGETVLASMQPALVAGVITTFWLQSPKDRLAGMTTGAFVLREAAKAEPASLTEWASAIETTLRQAG